MFSFIGRRLRWVLLCGALCAAQTVTAAPEKPLSARDAEFRGFVIQGQVVGAVQLDVLVLDARGEPLHGALYELKDGALQDVLPLPLGVEAVIELKALGPKGESLAESRARVGFDDMRHGSNTLTFVSAGKLPIGSVSVSPIAPRVEALETGEPGLLRYELRAVDADGREVAISPEEVTWEVAWPPRTRYMPCKPSGSDSVACIEFKVPVKGKHIPYPEVNACVTGSLCFAVVTPPPAQTVNGFKAITAGASHTCGLTFDGRIFCWGANADRQLAQISGETCPNSPPLHAVISCSKWPAEIICPQGSPCRYTAVDAGFSHTCATDIDGAVWCWGSNGSSRLGFSCTPGNHDPDCTGTATPRRVNIPGGAEDDPAPFFVQISAGDAHSCALSAVGHVYCWGSNAHSQLGHAGSNAPQMTPSPNTYSQVSAGVHHTCAVTTAGNLDCWGNNQRLQITDDFKVQFYDVPTEVRGYHPALAGRVTVVATSERNTCVSAESSGIVCWGAGAFGDVAISPAVATDLDLGEQSPELCAVIAGEVSCGMPNFGLAPVAGSVPGFIDVAVGGDHLGHYCGVLATGRALCWGENGRGQQGSGSTAYRQFPGRVLGP